MKIEFWPFFDNFQLLLVNNDGLKNNPDNLGQHGTIHVLIPQEVREKKRFKQTDAVTDTA